MNKKEKGTREWFAHETEKLSKGMVNELSLLNPKNSLMYIRHVYYKWWLFKHGLTHPEMLNLFYKLGVCPSQFYAQTKYKVIVTEKEMMEVFGDEYKKLDK